MRFPSDNERARTRKIKNQYRRYIEGYYYTNHKFPTMRQIQTALDIPSLSTVSRYVHKLIDEGTIKWPEPAKRYNLLDNKSLCVYDQSPRRKCIRTRDGSVLYLDCQVVQGSNGNLDVQVSGVVDLSLCKQNITQVVSCMNAEGF